MIEIVSEPTLIFQYVKGLLLGLLIGWFISSYLYYRQYSELIKIVNGEED